MASSGVAGALGATNIFSALLAWGMCLGLLSILEFGRQVQRANSGRARAAEASIAKINDNLSSISLSLVRQSEKTDECLSVSKRLYIELQEYQSAQQKSLGLLFRELRYVTSILSGEEAVMTHQSEKRLTTVLLALKAAKRDIESAISRSKAAEELAD